MTGMGLSAAPRNDGCSMTTLRCRPAVAPSGGNTVKRCDNLVDHVLDQHFVVALPHHADHRLGAGGADDQAAVAVEAALAVLDGAAHLGVLERLAALVAHV